MIRVTVTEIPGGTDTENTKVLAVIDAIELGGFADIRDFKVDVYEPDRLMRELDVEKVRESLTDTASVRGHRVTTGWRKLLGKVLEVI